MDALSLERTGIGLEIAGIVLLLPELIEVTVTLDEAGSMLRRTGMVVAGYGVRTVREVASFVRMDWYDLRSGGGAKGR